MSVGKFCRGALMGALLTISFPTAIAAQPASASAELDAMIDAIHERLVSVWENEVKAAIDLVPEYRGRARGVGLVEPPRTAARRNCPEVPRLRANPSRIEYTREIILYHLMIEQANLLYFTGVIDDPAELDRYLTEVLLDEGFKARALCRDNLLDPKPYPDRFPTIASHLGWTETRYTSVISDLRRRYRLLADYSSAFPIFFVLLHEFGHIQNGDGPGSFNLEKEMAADRVAIRVMHANKVPSTFGAGHLLFFSDEAGRVSRESACRIEALAKADNRPGRTPDVYLPELGRAALRRLGELRDHYIRRYGAICRS